MSNTEAIITQNHTLFLKSQRILIATMIEPKLTATALPISSRPRRVKKIITGNSKARI